MFFTVTAAFPDACSAGISGEIILKEDETPTSIGGELQQFSLGGSPISFQDKASGGSQAWSVEECNAFDHTAARTPEAFLNIM